MLWFAIATLFTATFAGSPSISRAQNQIGINAQAKQQPSSQISILLMGIDEHQLDGDAAPTNTMVVLSLNSTENSGMMLFLPHNLWVSYPTGYGEGLLSQARNIGDTLDYPGGGGAEMATQTVSALLGIPIQHYLVISFESFIAFFEAIGKIEVCPSETIVMAEYDDGSSEPRRVAFEEGCQKLDAVDILAYARVTTFDEENTEVSFGRFERQREIMLSTINKILSAGGASTLARNAKTIWTAVYENVRTDLTLQQLIDLTLLAEAVPLDNIQNTAISGEYVIQHTLPNETQVLVPVPEKVEELVEELFGSAALSD
jgi:LCP family protein required for cell wall assembly